MVPGAVVDPKSLAVECLGKMPRSANSRSYKSMCKLTKERKYPWKQGCPTITETQKKTNRSAGACNAAS